VSDLRILATSREPLRIPGEASWQVPSFSLPASVSGLAWTSQEAALTACRQSEAVLFFLERAARISPEFALTEQNAAGVAEICRRLDGRPLAIELAAAWVRVLSVSQIAERLEGRSDLLAGGSRTAAPRQQTLTATLDWSHDLLSEQERTVFRSLAVFAGGWTLEAAELVCSGAEVGPRDVHPVVSRLVEKSLVMAEAPKAGERRYRMLLTIREYALSKLKEAGEAQVVRARHLAYFLQFAEQAQPHLSGPEQWPWLDRLEAEHDNLRAALDWSLVAPNAAGEGLRLAVVMGEFWKLRGHLSEGRRRLETALAHKDTQSPTLERAQALQRASVLAFYQSDYQAVRRLCEESLAVSRELGAPGRLEVARSLELLAEAAAETGDYEAAPELHREALALFREVGNRVGIADTLKMMGWGAMRTGDYEQAASQLEEALVVCRQSGDPRHITPCACLWDPRSIPLTKRTTRAYCRH
jgi:non-specific serine/threonine protein kinase